MISLNKDELVTIKLGSEKLSIHLGSRNNRVVIAKLSLWYNFKDKDKSITKKFYVYDPRSFTPEKPTSRARKIIGDGEKIILGSIRNQLYFSEKGSWDNKLSPEHIVIQLCGNNITLICLSKNAVKYST